VDVLAKHGAQTARDDLARKRLQIRRQDAQLAPDACVLLLGGSNGILLSVATQLLFAERAAVYAVHKDSEKLQIGPHHASAVTEAAKQEGVSATFVNQDATSPECIAKVVADLKAQFRVVHLINGIAAGAPKRFAEHGPIQVPDLDVAFDPVRQTPDFSKRENLRKLGLVEVDVATEQDIERTDKFMGHSTDPWAAALADAGLLVEGESLVAFADYEFEPNDPVYGMGPLARAKVIQRESLAKIQAKYRVRTTRLCYPPMCTTAIGAIPGGLLKFAGTAQLMLEKGTYQNLTALAAATMPAFRPSFRDEALHVDGAYKAVRPAFEAFVSALTADNVHDKLALLLGNPAV
jgi:enoyl-[acyl-carrier protein] reductase/trans-2-enoyl-CoA reductase (NAD+)